MKLPIYQVDAFATGPFSGNPAAVVPLQQWLSDVQMQAIAAENNLSETAFIVRDGDRYGLRWFTPATEVDLCGHATLAAGYVIGTYLEAGRTQIGFDSRSGPLGVHIGGELLTLDFPAATLRRAQPASALIAALGATPAEYYESDYEMAVYASEAEVAALDPDCRSLAGMIAVGIIVTAPGDSCDFVSRFFAPAAGIDEDPATGSAHCILTPYWSERLGKKVLDARQISARGAQLGCAFSGDRVQISGRVFPYLQGTIEV